MLANISADRRKPTRVKLGKPRPVDVHVGSRVRLRRTMLGMSQEKLGNAINLTFQQVQKYEKASNKVSAGRLFRLSQILDVPVSFFFDDMQGVPGVPGSLVGAANQSLAADENIVSRRETLELIKAYYAVSDEKLRKEVLSLVRRMAESLCPPANVARPTPPAESEARAE